MSAKSPPSLYDVLGLDPGASAQDVRQAWRRLAQQNHPDRGEGADSEAMVLINQAYEVLSDPDRRARYDHGQMRPSEPRQPGRVELPGQRAKKRLIWGAAGTLVLAGATWAIVHGLGKADAPSPPVDGVRADSTRPAARAAAIRSPARPMPVLEAGQAADAPLRLIPASRIEEPPPAPRRP